MAPICWSWYPNPTTRIDKALKEVYPFLSQKIIQLWLEKGGIHINQRPAQKTTSLTPRATVTLQDPTPILSIYPQPALHSPISICFENQDLIIANKPAGMPSHPLTPWDTDTAAQRVLAHCPTLIGIGETRAPGLLHRLDNDTSGLLAFAKTPASYTICSDALHRGLWKKEYLCWVHGFLYHPQTIEAPICHHSSSTRMVLAHQTHKQRGQPQPTRTHIKPITLCWVSLSSTLPPQPATAVWVQIETGVRHQIRVHLASLGHPIIGDTLYSSTIPYSSTTPATPPSTHNPSHPHIPEQYSEYSDIPALIDNSISLQTYTGMMLHAWRLTFPDTVCSMPVSCIPPFPFPIDPNTANHRLPP